MPKISKADLPGGVSLDVMRAPTQSIESAGMVSKAQSQVAGQVSRIAGEFGQQLAQSEARTQAIKNKAEFTLQADSLLEDMKKEEKYADSMEGFTQDYQQRLGDLHKDVLDTTTHTPLSRRASENALSETNLSSQRKAQSYERNERVAKVYQNAEDVTDLMGQDLAINYSPDKHVQNITTIQNMFRKEEEIWTPEQSRKGIKNFKNKQFDSLSTYYETNPGIVSQGISLLEGKYPQSKAILDGISSEKRNATLERLKRIQKQNNSMSKASISRHITDLKAAVYSGKKLRANDFNRVSSMALEGAFDNSAEMANTVQGLQAIHDQNEKFSQMNAKEKAVAVNDKLKLGEVEGAFNAAQREALQDMFLKVKQNTLKNMETKGADFAAGDRQDIANQSQQILNPLNEDISDEELYEATQSYVSNTRTYQQDAGITNIKFLTEDMQNSYSDAITNKEGQIGAVAIERIQKSFGDASGSVLKELLQSKKIAPEHSTVFYSQDYQSKTRMLENIRNKDKIEEDFRKTKSTNPNIDLNDVLIDKDYQSFKVALNKTNPGGANRDIMNGFTTNVMLEYKRLMSAGGEVDHDKAKQQAIDTVINNNFDFTSSKTPLMIPKDLGVDKDVVDNFTEDSLDEMIDFSNAADIQPPKNFKGSRSNYINHISDTGVWVWNGGDGAVLYEDTGNGLAEIKDSMDRKIELKYSEMNESAFKFKRKRMAYTKTGLKEF